MFAAFHSQSPLITMVLRDAKSRLKRPLREAREYHMRFEIYRVIARALLTAKMRAILQLTLRIDQPPRTA